MKVFASQTGAAFRSQNAIAMCVLVCGLISLAGCYSGVPGTGTTKSVAPQITMQPLSVAVTAGQTATFTVAASGTQPLTYQWQKNQANIAGANSASYTTPATAVADNGAQFDVIVSNGTFPNATSVEAALTVNPTPVAPQITTQPQSVTVTAGQTATFSVAATGTQPLSYQWQKNQSNITGANSASYTTPVTSLTDSGATFDVIVSNGILPNATSTAVTLTVNPVQQSSVNVLTYHNDLARTGLNPNETTLTTTNVATATFGKLGTMPVTSNVDAEPLYASNLTIGAATHNVVFAATENDMVYAFDADTFTQLWNVSVADGESPANEVDGCGQVQPNIGVTSTPVIDLNAGPHGTIFLVAMTLDSNGNYHQRLHALDLTTGQEEAGSPAAITATYTIPNTTTQLTFNPMQYKERAGLLSMNGIIYLAWASHCDDNPYQGWIMAYNESTLQQTQTLDITPNGSEGAIWMADSAMAADSSGNIYFLVGNGTFGDGSSNPALTTSGFPANGNYGNAFMKLSTSGGSSLAVADYFAMFNANGESGKDEDLGSGGAILLPDLTNASGVTKHLAVGAGKDAYIYVVDRDSMGKYNSSDDTAIYQKLNDPSGNATGPPALGGGSFSMPAYFNSVVYYGGAGDVLRAFPVANALLATQPSSTSSVSFGFPGCTPSISANGTTNGIVWCISAQTTGVLYAFSAANLALQLYNSNQASSRDEFPDSSSDKFVTPLIANGKVYMGTPTGVVVFGLLP